MTNNTTTAQATTTTAQITTTTAEATTTTAQSTTTTIQTTVVDNSTTTVKPSASRPLVTTPIRESSERTACSAEVMFELEFLFSL